MKRTARPQIPPPIAYIKKRYSHEQQFNWFAASREYAQILREGLRKEGRSLTFDTTSSMMDRRIRAAAAMTDGIIDRYKGIKGLEEEHRDEVGGAWLHMNFLPNATYNIIEKNSCILCAASIWILDQITAEEGWDEKLYPLLPHDELLLNDLNIPELWDTNYDINLILSVLCVLYRRDSDVGPLEKDGDVFRVLTHSMNAQNAQRQDVSSRRTFDALMTLIPEEAKERACRHFEELFWSWLDRYFMCIAPIQIAIREAVEKSNDIAREYNEKRDEVIKIIDEVENSREKLRQNQDRIKVNPLLNNPLYELPDTALQSDPFSAQRASKIPDFAMNELGNYKPIEQAFHIAKQMTDLQNRHEEAVKAFDDIANNVAYFTFELLRLGYMDPDECAERFGASVAEHMKLLTVSNPYEICFALLWLIESGSDLPWLYGPGCGLLREVTDSLPWGINCYERDEDIVWNNGALDALSASQNGTVKPLPIPDWYARKYVPKDEKAAGLDRSLAQIVYEETGCIMPRELHKYDVRRDMLKNYGITGQNAITLLYLFSVLSQARRRKQAYTLNEAMIRVWDEETAADDEALSIEELKAHAKQMREENKALRTSLHETERNMRAVREELASTRDLAALEHRELADLRELIFNQEASAEQEKPDEAVDESAFPYEVKATTVIFGGHETWLKTIRSLLTGNIRFVDKDLVFDTSIVRGADVVWIQPNAMAHKQYYRIIESARRYRKPVRYFTFASAVKSAEQVMRADSGA